MAEIKPLSHLTEATALANDDVIPIVSGGATKKVKVSTIQGSLFPGGVVAVEAVADLLLSYPDKTAAKVGNDTDPANNGDWRKEGAEGVGSWVQSSFDRGAVVERRVTVVEQEKITKDPGTNLFDVNASDIAYGKYLFFDSGILGTNVLYNATGFIPVTGGSTYTLSYKNRICWYDANKTYISGSDSSDLVKQQTAPPTAAYLRCSVTPAASSVWDNFQVEEGALETAFKPYTPFGFTEGISARIDPIETNIVTLQDRATAIEARATSNLDLDPLNRIAERDGVIPWNLGGIFYTDLNMSVVDTALSPYTGRKALKQTNAPGDLGYRAGHKISLEALGLKEGDEITAAIHGYAAENCVLGMFFRDIGGSPVGDATSATIMPALTDSVVSNTKTVPANAVTLETILQQPMSGTAGDVYIFATGLWYGPTAYEIREGKTALSLLVAAENRTIVNEGDIATLQAEMVAVETLAGKKAGIDGLGEIRASALPSAVFSTTFLEDLVKVRTTFSFGTTAIGEGREFVAATTENVNAISFEIDPGTTPAFKALEPKLVVFIYNLTDGLYLYQRELDYADWGDSIDTGTLVLSTGAITIEATKTYRVGFCPEQEGMKTPGGILDGDIGGYVSTYRPDQSAWNSWIYTGHALAFKLGRASKRLTDLYELGYHMRSVVDPAAVEVFTGLFSERIDAAYDPNTYLGWGTIFQPVAEKTFNVVEIAPIEALVDETLNAYIEIRLLTDLETVTDIATISGREWNEAVTSAGLCYAVFDTTVVFATGVQVAITQRTDEGKMNYRTMTKTAEVIDRVHSTGGAWSASSTAPVTPYMHPLYDPTATRVSALPMREADVQSAADIATTQVLAALDNPPDIVLPRTIYGLLGDDVTIEQMNLYFHNMIAGDLDRLMPDVDATYGTQYEAWLRIEPGRTVGVASGANPTAAGTFPLTVKALAEDFTVLSTATTTVDISDKTTKTTQHRHLCIGDSMTRGGAFLDRLLDGITGVELRGIRHYSYDRAGLNREGRGGWTIGGYVNPLGNTQYGAEQYSPFVFPIGKTGPQFWGNTAFWKEVVGAGGYSFDGFEKIARGWLDEPNPFLFDANGYPISPKTGDCVVDPGLTAGTEWQEWSGSAWTTMAPQPTTEVNFTKYLDRFTAAYDEGAGMVPPDSVSIMLGTNTFASQVAGADPAYQATWITRMRTLIDAIRTALPTAPIIVIMPIMGADQNEAGALYKTATTAERVRRNMQECGRLILDNFDNDTDLGNGLYLSHALLALDTVLGFGTRTEARNKYMADLITIPNDMIHPATEGYYQMGDALAAAVQKVRT